VNLSLRLAIHKDEPTASIPEGGERSIFNQIKYTEIYLKSFGLGTKDLVGKKSYLILNKKDCRQQTGLRTSDALFSSQI